MLNGNVKEKINNIIDGKFDDLFSDTEHKLESILNFLISFFDHDELLSILEDENPEFKKISSMEQEVIEHYTGFFDEAGIDDKKLLIKTLTESWDKSIFMKAFEEETTPDCYTKVSPKMENPKIENLMTELKSNSKSLKLKALFNEIQERLKLHNYVKDLLLKESIKSEHIEIFLKTLNLTLNLEKSLSKIQNHVKTSKFPTLRTSLNSDLKIKEMLKIIRKVPLDDPFNDSSCTILPKLEDHVAVGNITQIQVLQQNDVDKKIDDVDSQVQSFIDDYTASKNSKVFKAKFLNLQKRSPHVADQILKNLPQFNKNFEKKISNVLNLFMSEDEKVSEDEFALIRKERWEFYKNQIKFWDEKTDKNLLKSIFPNLLTRLATKKDFKDICEENLFVQKQSPFYGVNERMLLILLNEKIPDFSHRFMKSYSLISGKPLPLVYPSPDDYDYVMPLKHYSSLFYVDRPIVFSFGEKKIGKSKLLNHIFFSKFNVDNYSYMHQGADIVFTTDHYQLGLNLIDVQMDFEEKKIVIERVLKNLPKNMWFLIQTTKPDTLDQIMKMMARLGYDSNQIIWLIRDTEFCDQETDHELQVLSSFENLASKYKMNEANINYLPRISEANTFITDLNITRDRLMDLMGGFGKIATKPSNNHLSTFSLDNYKNLELQITPHENHSDKILKIVTDDHEMKRFKQNNETILTELTKLIYQKNEITNLQDILFPGMRMKKELEEKKKILLRQKYSNQPENSEKIEEALKLAIEQIEQLQPHILVRIYEETIRQTNSKRRIEFENQLANWQEPLMAPLIQERLRLKDKLSPIEQKLSRHYSQIELKSANKDFVLLDILEDTMLNRLINKKQEIENLIIKNSEIVDNIRINREHFWREIIFLYTSPSPNIYFKSTKEFFFKSFADYVRSGGEFELINGDNNMINDEGIQNVFSQIHQEADTRELFVISIIGIQSSGKSSLLNFMFGSNFQTSAGRCTRGLYASYFQTGYPKAKECLVLDTEGLLSIDRKDSKFDKKMTILAMSLSQVMIINVNGEINEAMKDILEISFFAARELKIGMGRKPVIIFVLRNMRDIDMNKQREMIEKIGIEFKKVAELVNVKLDDIVDYRDEKSFELMFSAYHIDNFEVSDQKLFSFCIVNSQFRKSADDLRDRIFSEALNEKAFRFPNLIHVHQEAKIVWKTLSIHDNLMLIKDIKEARDRSELMKILDEISESIIEPSILDDSNKLESLKYRLDKILEKGSKEIEFDKRRDIMKEIISEENISKAKAESKFKQKTNGPRYSKALKDEYIKMINSKINLLIEQAQEDWKYISSELDIKSDIHNEIDRLNHEQIFLIRKFEKNSSKEKSDTIKLQMMEVIKKEFAKKIEKNRADFFEKHKQKKKSKLELLDRVFNMFVSISHEQQYQTGRILDNYWLETIKHEIEDYKSIFELDWRINHELIHNEMQKICKPTHEYNYTLDSPELFQETIDPGNAKEEDDEEESGGMISKLFKKLGDLISWKTSKDDKKKIEKNPKKKNPKLQKIQEKKNEERWKANLIVFSEMKAEVDIFLKFEDTRLDINSLRSKIDKIKDLISKIESMILRPIKFMFSGSQISAELVKLLFKRGFQKMIKDEEENYVMVIKKFEDEIKYLDELFGVKLKATFGDKEKALEISKIMLKNIINYHNEIHNNEIIEKLKSNTKFGIEKLASQAYKSVEGDDRNAVFKFFTNETSYLEEIYKDHFEKKQNFELQNCHIEFKSAIDDKIKFLKNAVGKCNDFVFKSIKIKQNFDDGQSKDRQKIGVIFFKIFTKFLVNQDYDEEIQELEQKYSNFVEISRNKLRSSNPDRETFAKEEIFEEEFDDFMNSEVNKINEPEVFFTFMEKEINYQFESSKVKFEAIQNLNDTISGIYNTNMRNAIGCRHRCPYCGAKCTEGPGHTKHQAKKHRMMGLKLLCIQNFYCILYPDILCVNGCWERTKDVAKEFLTDFCDSNHNLYTSKWKDSNELRNERGNIDNIQTDGRLRERILQENGTIGNFNISLQWNNINDLDLHVTCPCGTLINYANKKCQKCQGYLDIDMNCQVYDGENPVEHVYFTEKLATGVYNFKVRFYGRRDHGKFVGSSSSKFTVKCHNDLDEVLFNSGEMEVSESCREKDFSFFFGKSISFTEHCNKFYPDWAIAPNDDLDNQYIQNTKKWLKSLNNELLEAYKLD